MHYTLKQQGPKPKVETDVGHDDDQHVKVLFGEDITALKQVSELEDGQPEGSTESFHDVMSAPTGCDANQQANVPVRRSPAVSRVIDDVTGRATVKIILGSNERENWLAHVVGLIDAASENDIVDITIVPNNSGICDTLSHRSILSAIDRCRATVITRAGALSNMGDVVLWLSGDQLNYSKNMSVIFMRQPLAGFAGDISDFGIKGDDALQSVKEYSAYIVERGLFTKDELQWMFESSGMLCLYGKKLEERVAGLKNK